VEIAVGIPRKACALDPRRLHEAPPREEGGDVEPVPLGEVLGRDPPAASHPDHDRTEVVNAEGNDPHGNALVSVDEPGEHQQRTSDDRGRRKPDQRATTVSIAAHHGGGEDEMKETHDEVCAAEQHSVVAEGARHGQRDEQHRPHRRQHRQPNAALVDVQRARQPRVDVPRPPEGGEHEHPAQHSAPGRVVRQKARDLGKGERQHQVEEQLEWCDLVLVAVLKLRFGGRHGRQWSGRRAPRRAVLGTPTPSRRGTRATRPP
jgi:hypothetical protein